MVYPETDYGPFWIMDDDERRLSIFSLRFWRVKSAIICYFYNVSYLYMPLYQFYNLSTAFMFKIKPACRVEGQGEIQTE